MCVCVCLCVCCLFSCTCRSENWSPSPTFPVWSVTVSKCCVMLKQREVEVSSQVLQCDLKCDARLDDPAVLTFLGGVCDSHENS